MERRSRQLLIVAAVTAVGVGAGVLATLARSEARAPLPADLDQIRDEASRIDGLVALLARRDGEMVLESYFDGAGPDDLFHLRSATKSVLSLLIGIALDQGHLTSVDQTLGEVLGARVEPFGPRKAALTLEHLLTMSAGLEWHEDEDVDEFNRLVTARDPVAYYLERPFVAAPGAEWAYASGASHVLSAVLSAATGMTASAYAREHLFAPLGIERFRWPTLADGNTNGAAGLQLRPRDTLRIGELLLAGGSWSGRRIVSREWLETATRNRFALDQETRYGYHWWIIEPGPVRAWVAMGYAGQTLSVVPERKIVVVTNCRWRSLGRSPAAQSQEVGRLIGRRLMPFFIPEIATILERRERR